MDGTEPMQIRLGSHSYFLHKPNLIVHVHACALVLLFYFSAVFSPSTSTSVGGGRRRCKQKGRERKLHWLDCKSVRAKARRTQSDDTIAGNARVVGWRYANNRAELRCTILYSWVAGPCLLLGCEIVCRHKPKKYSPLFLAVAIWMDGCVAPMIRNGETLSFYFRRCTKWGREGGGKNASPSRITNNSECLHSRSASLNSPDLLA
ncbi:hypothetical protein BX070DRAFT_132230 [Coemansia spiralis]|nr:hypothetical protein BX070DRAFT_132230 [Coemansia spiralis]